MSAEELPVMYKAACMWAMRGLRILPVEHHSREAMLEKWPENASNAASDVDRRFAGGDVNIGLCCGPQENGWSLLAVDIDPQSGGKETWAALVAEHGPLPTPYPVHTSPSGGRHIFFDVPPEACVTGTNTLGQGIDTRGGRVEGDRRVGCGYVLLPPSVAASKAEATLGELVSYGAQPGRSLLDLAPGPAPAWLLDMLVRPVEVERSARRHPSAGRPLLDESSAAEFVRSTYSWDEALLKHGWSTRDGRYWTRPGKSVRDGHSAELHDDGRLAIWTGDIPDEVRRLGAKQIDGGVSISLFSFIAAYEHGGDLSEFGRVVRAVMPPSPRLFVAGAGTVDPTTTAAIDSSGLNLPPEFWEAMPLLAHIREDALAMGGSPDAALGAWLARYAATIHPALYLPALVADDGSLDFMAVLVGVSGEGKSSPMRRAAKLLPSQRTDLRLGYGLGSGEGMIDLFYGMRETEVDGKKGKPERAQIFKGINLTVDEGALLKSLSERKGSTQVDYMCTAWSGGTLSTANASSERFRHVEAGTFRFSATLGIQVDLANGLWTDSQQAQGFTGRLTFFMATGGEILAPDDRPEPPGPMRGVAYPPGSPRAIGFPQEVWDEVRENHYQRRLLAKAGTPGPALDNHLDLQRSKLAAILACAEGRLDTTMLDWSLATTVVSTSVRVRDALRSYHTIKEGDAEHSRAEQAGRRQVITNAVIERDKLVRYRLACDRKIPPDGITLSRLERSITDTWRYLWPQILDDAVGLGEWRVDNGRVFKVRR